MFFFIRFYHATYRSPHTFPGDISPLGRIDGQAPRVSLVNLADTKDSNRHPCLPIDTDSPYGALETMSLPWYFLKYGVKWSANFREILPMISFSMFAFWDLR